MQQGSARRKSEEGRLAQRDLAGRATENQKREQKREVLGETDQETGPDPRGQGAGHQSVRSRSRWNAQEHRQAS